MALSTWLLFTSIALVRILSPGPAVLFFILTTTFMLFSFSVLVTYALTAHTAKVWFVKGDRALWFNRISGTIFITFGLGMLRLRNRNA
jgi:homoserine/homoserine lactone efflux protein